MISIDIHFRSSGRDGECQKFVHQMLDCNMKQIAVLEYDLTTGSTTPKSKYFRLLRYAAGTPGILITSPGYMTESSDFRCIASPMHLLLVQERTNNHKVNCGLLKRETTEGGSAAGRATSPAAATL